VKADPARLRFGTERHGFRALQVVEFNHDGRNQPRLRAQLFSPLRVQIVESFRKEEKEK
jgi:hypothetical protein